MNPKRRRNLIYQAVGTALGLALGGRLLPRLLWPHLYTGEHPLMAVDVFVYFLLALSVAAVVVYLFDRWYLSG